MKRKGHEQWSLGILAFIPLSLRSRNHRTALGIRTGTRRAMSANPAVRAHPLTEPLQRRRHRPLRSTASAVLPLSDLDTVTAAIWLLRYCFSSVVLLST